MVIFQKKVGQLGNQLFSMAHFAASAIEYNYKVIYPNFEYPLANFPNIKSFNNLQVFNSSDSANRIIHGLFKSIRRVVSSSPFHECILSEGPPFIDTGSLDFVDKARTKLIACEGFGFRDPQSTIKHHSEIARIFELSERIKELTNNYLKQNIINNNLLVGFHIRRKDYRTYSGGKYFYDDHTWIRWIENARNLFSEKNRKFIGIVFSDEAVPNIINSGNDLISGPGDMFCDLDMLSRCDYILGPPSTFSGWASYIGKVPKLNLESRDAEVVLKNFIFTKW